MFPVREHGAQGLGSLMGGGRHRLDYPTTYFFVGGPWAGGAQG